MLSEDELDDLIADNNFQQGRDYERERIIALLKEASGYATLKRNGEPAMLLEATIALIKGENNG